MQQSTEFLEKERLEELAKDPQNRIYQYEYDQIEKVMTAKECRAIVKQMYALIKTWRAEDILHAVHEIIAMNDDDFDQIVEHRSSDKDNVLFRFTQDTVAEQLLQSVERQNFKVLSEYEPLLKKISMFQVTDIAQELQSQPVKLSLEEESKQFTVVSGQAYPVKYAPVVDPEHREFLLQFHRDCESQKDALWNMTLDAVCDWDTLSRNDIENAVIDFCETRTCNFSLDTFIKWRKLHPTIKTLDLRQKLLQTHPEWTEFVKTHRSIFEFLTDPRMSQRCVDEAILYMIYVKELMENGQYADVNQARKEISVRLVKLFSRHDIPLDQSKMNEFMRKRNAEDDLFKKNIAQKLI
jgi:hypothetical protein